MPSRRRCRPDELCSTMTDVAALTDCDSQSGNERCACPRGFVLQHGACVGTSTPPASMPTNLVVHVYDKSVNHPVTSWSTYSDRSAMRACLSVCMSAGS